jgi:hypothetical protein
MSVEASFKTALMARLSGEVEVQAILGNPPRIYDRAPGGAAFPFLTVGQGETTPVDADTPGLNDHRLTLHIWGRRDDRDAVRDALGAVRTALHQADLSLSGGARCVLCRVVYTDFFTAPDGRTLHGVLRVRALLD